MADENVISKQAVIDQINALTVDTVFSQTDVNYLINYLIANGDITGSPRDMIQVRRGNKANLPNLAQGELAVTLDTEELYVGGLSGNIKVGKKSFGVNVMDYGAKGDGIQDDSPAFSAALLACPIGGQLLIPSPENYYRMSSPFMIDKSISIIGPSAKFPFSTGTEMIQFDANCDIGFNIRTNDLRIDGLTILMKSVTNTLIAGIFLNTLAGDPGGFMRNIHISNLEVLMMGSKGSGIFGRSVITSSFTNVKCQQGMYGFKFDDAFGSGTSCKFDSCWTINNVEGGYSLEGYYYSTFINCAADTVNGAGYAYFLNRCESINFVGCGAEKFLRAGWAIYNSIGVTFNGCFTTGITDPVFSSFAELRGTTQKVIMLGCGDRTVTAFPNVTKDGSCEYPVIMNCNFPTGFSADGTVTPTPTNKGYILLGSTLITDNGIVPGFVSALPPASEAYRGRTLRLQLGSGYADTIHQCLKSATNTYSWKQITAG